MRSHKFKSILVRSGFAAALLLASGAGFAQQQINLTAGPATAPLAGGGAVPMWGYSCGAVVTGSTATCAPLNPTATAGTWSPVVIRVSSGQSLQINLTNNLSFTTGTATPNNNIPTSLTIVGQLGGGLGTPTNAASPTHAPTPNTWFIAGDTTGSVMNPPAQGSRVQSFATEVPAGGGTASTASLTWTTPSPGTYLIESGTHPSIQGAMGLYGILVVTCAPGDTTGCTAGTAYPGVSYAADVALLLSEIDPVQNAAVDAAVRIAGFGETSARVMRDSVSSVVLSVDANGNVINAGKLYTTSDTITFGLGCVTPPAAHVSQVDGTGAIVAIAVDNPGAGCSMVPTATVSSTTGSLAQVTAALSLSGVVCSDGHAACYPPAVNYTPMYFLINGQPFNGSSSVFATTPASVASGGSVLVRLVNAGLRMHVPSIVGSTIGAALTPGMSLIAEDGNVLPGVPRVQSEVFMAAGKTYDVIINAPGAAALPIFDRELSLSANSINRDAGMLAYITANGAAAPAGASAALTASAVADSYAGLFAGQSLSVSDPSKGVIANDVNVYSVALLTQATNGTVTLNSDGTFSYTPAGTATTDSFTYCANTSADTIAATGCPAGLTAAVSLSASTAADSGVTCTAPTFSSNIATSVAIKPPGVLAGCTDGGKLPLSIVGATSSTPKTIAFTGGTAVVDVNGGFTATASTAGSYTFNVTAQSTAGKQATMTVTVNLLAPSNLVVNVLDGADHKTPITDYRWVIEEDRTFYVDPACTTNPVPTGCPVATSQGTPFIFGTNFHTSNMPVVAAGCTGPLSCESGQTLQGMAAVCDIGNGVCRTDAGQEAPLDPKNVHLDPTKRYYLSILPGDSANPFIAGYTSPPDCSPAGMAAGSCGHGMGGAEIAAACKPVAPAKTCTGTPAWAPVTVLSTPSPYPPAKLTVFVFEDDYPLNGEHDPGGGIDVISPQEPGLGSFQVTLFDDAGGTGDATGQPTYDMFNQPLTNSLAGTIDPVTGLDACPISPVVTNNVQSGDGTQQGIIGMIITCPKYESDGATLSPMVGQAIVDNLYQGRYGVVATPGADRIARGEEWLQTNTLDGQKAHDSFMRIGEPAYFQEFGPAGYHVSIGFANSKIITDRKNNSTHTGMCDPVAGGGGGLSCTNEVKGHITTARMSRVPDERLYGSGTRDSFAFTQCYVALGDPDGAEFAFGKCDPDGNFDLAGLPAGNWKLTVFDQWNDQIVDGIMQSVALACSNTAAGQCTGTAQTNVVKDMGEIATHQWQANIYTRTFFDTNGNGLSDHDAQGNDTELGLALVDQHPLPRWQLLELQQHRPERLCRLQRGVPAVQLVHDRDGFDALQDHRRARGARCGWCSGWVEPRRNGM